MERVGLDLFDLLEAMGAQYHEHQSDMLAWTWKVFCHKWARLFDHMERDDRRKRARARERDDEQERQRLANFQREALAGM